MDANGTLFDYLIGRFRETQRLARFRTPVRAAAGKLLRQLRREFVERLESVLGRRSERLGRFGGLVWFDDDGLLANAQVIYCNPIIRPDTPLILTLSLSYLDPHVSHACLRRLGWWRSPYLAQNSWKPRACVKVGPEDLLLFVPWIVKLVNDPACSVKTCQPVPCCGWEPSVEFDPLGMWTVRARKEVAAYEEARQAERAGVA